MNQNLSLIISLVLGLSILPILIVGSSEAPHNSPLMKPNWPTEPVYKLNKSQIVAPSLNKTRAVKEVSKKMIQITLPILSKLDRLFKREVKTTESPLKNYANDLKLLNKKPEDMIPSSLPTYIRLLRVIIQHVWKDGEEFVNKKPNGRKSQ